MRRIFITLAFVLTAASLPAQTLREGTARPWDLSWPDSTLVLKAWEAVEAAEAPAAPQRTWRAAFHTDLLMPLLNVGTEVTVGRRGGATLGLDYMYPWSGGMGAGTWCLEIQALTLSARWNLRDGTDPRRRGTGLSLGLAATAGYYDLCLHRRGAQGEALMGEALAAWSWSVNKGRWRMGVEARGGYLRSRMRIYDVREDGRPYRQPWERDMQWWGPTRVMLTLRIPMWHNVREK